MTIPKTLNTKIIWTHVPDLTISRGRQGNLVILCCFISHVLNIVEHIQLVHIISCVFKRIPHLLQSDKKQKSFMQRAGTPIMFWKFNVKQIYTLFNLFIAIFQLLPKTELNKLITQLRKPRHTMMPYLLKGEILFKYLRDILLLSLIYYYWVSNLSILGLWQYLPKLEEAVTST